MSDLMGVVGPWMRGRRWYQAKGAAASGSGEPAPRLVAETVLPAPRAPRPASLLRRRDAETAESRILLIEDSVGGSPVLYQVPVVLRSAPLTGAEESLIGLATVDRRRRLVYDGPHDPAFTGALLDGLLSARPVGPEEGTPAEGLRLVSSVFNAEGVTPDMAGHVLRGEQSNTSIIFEPAGPTASGLPVIAKLFRVLAEGTNPDVEVQTALAAEGSDHVARPVAALAATWSDAGRERTGTAVFAQEFLAGTEDAWRVALRACADTTDFTDAARTLGRATAEVHQDLARALPVTQMDADEVAAAVALMHDRLDAAVHEVPELARFQRRLGSILAAAAEVAWPARQRIHGDYHLGQVLAVADERAWVLLDFEGEPLKPMSERTRPDQPLRDVAGMLRSFDYVAGAVQREFPDVPLHRTTEWALQARDAFRAGYSAAIGGEDAATDVLLAAFEADKAVYEVVYEARNRPDWLDIPLGGIDRILATGADD